MEPLSEAALARLEELVESHRVLGPVEAWGQTYADVDAMLAVIGESLGKTPGGLTLHGTQTKRGPGYMLAVTGNGAFSPLRAELYAEAHNALPALLEEVRTYRLFKESLAKLAEVATHLQAKTPPDSGDLRGVGGALPLSPTKPDRLRHG